MAGRVSRKVYESELLRAHLLSSVPYRRIPARAIELSPRPPAVDYDGPPRDLFRQVPDYAASLAH
jgi:hypothetical protein